ncbi:MAG: zeta toxin family protein [Mycobacteriales bacterium]
MPADPARDPVLQLVAGPNGCGKTTLVTRILQPVTHLPFVNADVIAAERWPHEQAVRAYDASRAAAHQRELLLATRTSFITETVFSHPSKLALVERAQSLGYRVELHVVMLPEHAAVARVGYRERTGGHHVPEAKIRERYQRLWPLIARARDRAELTYVYDNSRAKRPLRLIARYDHGVLVGKATWPTWTPKSLR